MKTKIPEEYYESLDETMKALTTVQRLKIIYSLRNKELSVNHVTKAVNGKQSNISQHLSYMAGMGLLTVRKERTNVLFRLKDNKLINLLEQIQDIALSGEREEG